jgi:hypothetical protein
MNICNDGHDKIVHSRNKCPVCQLINDYEKNKSELENMIKDLKDDRNYLEDRVYKLEGDIDKLYGIT